MSATAQAQVPALPDPDTAYQNLFDGIHQRVFFNKMAAYGYVPQTPAQAQYMLEMAGKLRAVEQEAAVKQAQDMDDPYFLANQHLNQVLGIHGLDDGIKQAQAENEALAIKQAAAELANDPVFYNSVLSVKAAEAAQIEAELAMQQQMAGQL